MRQSHFQLILFILGRFSCIGLITFVLGSIANYFNYSGYWKGTIYSVQTVDFNILSHTLPTRISYLLINKNQDELQKALDSNYGFFGIVVTDCVTDQKKCLDQKIIARTNSQRSWTQKISTPEIAEATLQNAPFNILRNPPSIYTEKSFSHHWDQFPIETGKANQGQIIGRVYYLRGEPPSFWQDYLNWILRISSNFLQDSGASKYYSITVILLFVQILSLWWFYERNLLAKQKKQEQLEQEQQILEREQQYLVEQAQQRERGYNHQLDNLMQTLRRREQELESSRTNLSAEATKARELESTINDLQERLSLQERERLNDTRHLDPLRQLLEEQRPEQSLTQEQLQQRQQEIDRFSEELESREIDRENAQRQLDALHGELSVVRQREQAALDQVIVLQSEVEDSKTEIDVIQNEYQNIVKQLTNFQQREQQQLNLQQQLNDLHAWVEDLTNENDQLQAQLQERDKIIYRNQARIQHLEYRISADLNQPTIDNPIPSVETLERNCETVEQVLLQVQKRYSDIITIWDSAWRSVRDLNFEPFEKIYLGLEVLVTTGRCYFECEGNLGRNAWEQAFQEKGLSDVYRPTEFETTMNQYGRQRIFSNQGISRTITRHLTLKLGNDRYLPCVQIYFDVDRETRKIDIGYCGKHLDY
jgi:hypothetical protein